MAGNGRRSGGSRSSGGNAGTASAIRFPVKSRMDVERNLVNLQGRVNARSSDAFRAQNTLWNVESGVTRGSAAGLRRLVDQRIARIKPAQRAVDRYRRMVERSAR